MESLGYSRRNFLNPAIEKLESVASREVEREIEQIKRAGGDVIPVYGFPVVTLPAALGEVAREAAGSKIFPPSNGLLELRRSLADIIRETYGAAPDAEKEVLITNGANHGLHVVMTALLTSSDEVLLVSPCYFFGGLVKLAGAKVVTVPVFEREGYRLDFEKIRRRITPNTKVILMSSPVNPTGYVYSQEDVEQFIAIAEEHDLLLISDESYDRLLYDDAQHISPFHYPEARKRTVLVKSFTKSYALPNWRVGYVVADGELSAHFRKVLEWTVLHCPYVNQKVALSVLQGPQDWLNVIGAELQARRNELIGGIKGVHGYTCMNPRGGPFIFLNVSGVDTDCTRFASVVLEEFGIPAISGKYFYDNEHVRIPFGGSAAAVEQLVKGLELAAEKYRTTQLPTNSAGPIPARR